MVKKLLIIYICVDILLILVSLYFGKFWLINTQMAFVCSLLVVFSSFYGYQKMVAKKSKLLDDEFFEEEDEDKDIIKKTKKAVGVASGSFTPFRLFSYIFLAFTFLYLNRHQMLSLTPFLIGLSVVPIVSLVAGFFIKQDR